MLVASAAGAISSAGVTKFQLWHNEFWVLTSFIILLGVIFEKLEHSLKKGVPATYKPVVNGIFNELGALGFIATAVFLLTHPGKQYASKMFGNVLGAVTKSVGATSSHLLHDFEMLHFSLFFIINLYFLQVVFLVLQVIKNYATIRDAGSQYAAVHGSLTLGNAPLPAAIVRDMKELQEWTDKSNLVEIWGKRRRSPILALKLLWMEYTMPTRLRVAEFLLFQRRMNDNQKDKGEFFDMALYLEKCIGKLMESLVHITARGWMIMWFALSVFFLSRASLELAFGLTQVQALAATFVLSQVVIVVVGLVIALRLAVVKLALRPAPSQAALDGLEGMDEKAVNGGELLVLEGSYAGAPLYVSPDFKGADKKSAFVRWFRNAFNLLPPRNRHEQLFGTMGGSAPPVYKTLLQSLFFLSTFAVTINLAVIQKTPVMKGMPLLVKLCTFLPNLLLAATAPGLLLKLNYITNIEGQTKQRIVQELSLNHRRTKFQKAIRALYAFLLLFRDKTNNLATKLENLKELRAQADAELHDEEMLEAGLESSSPEVVALLEEAFEHARMYGGTGNSISEVIDRAQLQRAMMYLDFKLDDEQADLLFWYMDRYNCGKVDFKQFATGILLPLPGQGSLQTFSLTVDDDVQTYAVDHLFRTMDNDGDERIQLNEMQEVLRKSFPAWSPESLIPLFREMDEDNSGYVDREEFAKYLQRAQNAEKGT